MEYMETLTGGFCDIDCQKVGDCNSRNGLTGTSQCARKSDCSYCENSLADNTCSKVTWSGSACIVTASSSCGIKYTRGQCELTYMGWQCAGAVADGTSSNPARNCVN